MRGVVRRKQWQQEMDPESGRVARCEMRDTAAIISQETEDLTHHP